MILDHLDWTWPGGRIFIFWSWLPWIVVMTIFEQRSNDHPHFAWRCIAEKCTHWTPGGSKSMLHFWSQNVQVTQNVQVNPPEMQHLRFFSDQKSTGESTGIFLMPFSPSTPRISSQASPIRCRRKRLGTPRFQRLSGNVLWSLMEDWRWWAMAAKIRGYLGFFWMFVQRLFSQCFFKCQSKKPHWIPYWCQLLGQL